MLDIMSGRVTDIRCLDKGYVKLVDCMPRQIRDGEDTADHAIAEAARCSYQRGTKTITDDKILIRYLLRHNHTSPFEMVTFKFHMKLPIFVARQIVRHRTASINELSGRYSEMPDEFYIPATDNIRKQSAINKQGSEGRIEGKEADNIIDMLDGTSLGAYELYKDFLERDLVREQARMTLPLNIYTEWYWKIDLKNLLHFLDLRCDSHAQQEVQVYADAILDLIKPIVPWATDAWEDYSPYRGGMLLTRYEVLALRRILFPGGPLKTIEKVGKLENREWKEKAEILGLG